jgi:predicted tellurium resistance membrane protein TerC
MDFLTLDNLITLAMLTLLQAVLGFDNLLYISLESKRAPLEKQAMVRRLGIGLAMVLRIGLLLLLVGVIDLFKEPWFATGTAYSKASSTFTQSLSSLVAHSSCTRQRRKSGT